MTVDTVLSYDGIEQSIADWALDYGLTPAIILTRLERGMNPAMAISMPMKVGHRGQRLPLYAELRKEMQRRRVKKPQTQAARHSVGTETRTLRQWADHLGVSYTALTKLRSRCGMESAVALYRDKKRGVASNSLPSKGTGAGSTAQEIPNLDFSDKAENA